MAENCSNCSRDWQERYEIAERRFDNALFKAHITILVLAMLLLISSLVSAYCVIKTLRFIAKFEYVEETVVTQDGKGTNVAVVGDNNEIRKEF